MSSFGSRLAGAFAVNGQLCVGIDPHSWLLGEWALPDTASGARDFGLRVVEAAAGQVGIVKPQVAFFERFGSAGYLALEEVISAARAAGLLVIADVKRGDVGTSVEAYAQAWLEPGGPLESDAMTISAFQGVGSLRAPFELARQHGKGLFVLAATSNPEAAPIQAAMTSDGRSVASTICADIGRWNTADPGQLNSVGVVLGATLDLDAYGIDPSALEGTPILAPGFGHQGARVDELPRLFGPAAASVVVSMSRNILAAGPGGITAAIRTQAAEVASCRD